MCARDSSACETNAAVAPKKWRNYVLGKNQFTG